MELPIELYILIIAFGVSFTIYESILMSGKNKLEKDRIIKSVKCFQLIQNRYDISIDFEKIPDSLNVWKE